MFFFFLQHAAADFRLPQDSRSERTSQAEKVNLKKLLEVTMIKVVLNNDVDLAHKLRASVLMSQRCCCSDKKEELRHGSSYELDECAKDLNS